MLGSKLSGGEVIELLADLGGGKTTFVQGLAKGLGSKDVVSSPTFTLSKVYKARDDLEINHFDFYRLAEAGIMADQLNESLHEPKVITVVEWSEIVRGVLPEQRLVVSLEPISDNADARLITLNYPLAMQTLVNEVESEWEAGRT